MLTMPWALLALTALPALGAIYWFRRRSRKQIVSSLMFWQDHRQVRAGGRVLDRMQTPLLLLLELAAAALLAVAAAAPALRRADTRSPLFVVLDDSLSMQAGGARSARDLAVEALLEEIGTDQYAVRFIRAGATVSLMGQAVRSAPDARTLLADWTCQSPGADLARAVGLAGEIGGRNARVLVVTDHAPAAPLDGSRVRHWSFGREQPNAAFTAAQRSDGLTGGKVLLEVANFSDAGRSVSLQASGAITRQWALDLPAGGRGRVLADLPPGAGPLSARIGDDALAADNAVTLVSESASPVRAAVRIADEPLKKAALRALGACRGVIVAQDRPDVIFTDAAVAGDERAWRVRILSGKDAKAFTGPFVVDKAHPLADGLDLAGVIWAAGKDARPAGRALVTVGENVLLADHEWAPGRHEVQLALDGSLSTVLESPAWPVLVSNVAAWRARALPGPARANLALGVQGQLTLGDDVAAVQLTSPGRPPRTLAAHDRQVAFEADRAGEYTASAGASRWTFACNALAEGESDLRACRPGRWGAWDQVKLFGHELVDVSYLALLAVLGVLVVHAVLAARAPRSQP
ncbi:MAG: BatA domain-containing protein [Planctomycetota bacterium]|nr:BatA domain-containing protein [Planctomycetota bacterium]